MKFSDHIAEWLVELGYNRCFFVGGGNIMHLIERQPVHTMHSGHPRGRSRNCRRVL